MTDLSQGMRKRAAHDGQGTLAWATQLRLDLISQIKSVEASGLSTSADIEYLVKLRNRLVQVENLIATFESDS